MERRNTSWPVWWISCADSTCDLGQKKHEYEPRLEALCASLPSLTASTATATTSATWNSWREYGHRQKSHTWWSHSYRYTSSSDSKSHMCQPTKHIISSVRTQNHETGNIRYVLHERHSAHFDWQIHALFLTMHEITQQSSQISTNWKLTICSIDKSY